MIKAIIKHGVAKQIRKGHSWIFSGAILNLKQLYDYENGSAVRVVDEDDELLGWGWLNANNSLAIRLVKRQDSEFDSSDLKSRLNAAADIRNLYFKDQKTNIYRLINSEGDKLPGLIIDKFDQNYVVQISVAGMEQFQDEIVTWLVGAQKAASITIDKSSDIRKQEGLDLAGKEVVLGADHDLTNVNVLENGLQLNCNVSAGQKTGFYTDQRDKRELIKHLADGKQVLNLFSYSGSFGVYAAIGGAEKVLNVDSSKLALENAEANFKINGFKGESYQQLELDIWKNLDKVKELIKQADIVICDPPSLAKSVKRQPDAIRGYRALHDAIFSAIKPGSLLLTCSCTAVVDLEMFTDTVLYSASRQNKELKQLHVLTHGVDHPTDPRLLETNYLKAVLFAVS